MPTRYVCPKCGSNVELFESFLGWDVYSVNPDTGLESDNPTDVGIDATINKEYRCINFPICDWASKWNAHENWYRGVTDAIKKEQEEERSSSN